MTLILSVAGTPNRSTMPLLPWISLIGILSSIIHHDQYTLIVNGQPTSSTIPPTTTTTVNPNLNRNYDRFNYVATVQDEIHVDFGPEDWANVQCPDLGTCVRYFEYHREVP